MSNVCVWYTQEIKVKKAKQKHRIYIFNSSTFSRAAFPLCWFIAPPVKKASNYLLLCLCRIFLLLFFSSVSWFVHLMFSGISIQFVFSFSEMLQAAGGKWANERNNSFRTKEKDKKKQLCSFERCAFARGFNSLCVLYILYMTLSCQCEPFPFLSFHVHIKH